MPARLLGFLALLFWGPAAAAADPALADELRKGGYVLFIRHTSTDFSRNDAGMASFEDCANQRPLTDKGRDEARAIAGHLARLRIPIDRVYASPYCRTVETALLAFGKAEKTQDARGGPMKSDDPKRYDALRKLLSTPPAAGKNNVVSSHGNPFYAVFGAPYLAEGEIAVVRPRDSTVAGKIRLEDWPALR